MDFMLTDWQEISSYGGNQRLKAWSQVAIFSTRLMNAMFKTYMQYKITIAGIASIKNRNKMEKKEN